MTVKETIIKKISAEAWAIGTLSILYVVGIIGIVTKIHPSFIFLTPLNLLISLAIVLIFHQKWNSNIVFYLIFAYFVGFITEVFGVQTGLLFGHYIYGNVLGPKIWQTPLMIGINWVLLSYSIGVTTNYLLPQKHWFFKGFLAALLMVGLDVLIEPVAVRYDFWTWKSGAPPLQNYIGWFAVSLPLLCIFTKTHGSVYNKVAVALFILQILFFSFLNIL